MRRTAQATITASVVCGLMVLTGCSSSSSDSTGSDGAVPDGSFCSLYVAFRSSNDSLADDVNSGDAESAKAAITRLVSQTELLRKKAPPEIKADVDVVSDYVISFDQLFAEYGYDIDAFDRDEEASDKFSALSSINFDASLAELRRFADTECVAGGATTTTLAP